jgi:membrane-associated HD superfamily phosphohydrolase
MEFLQYISILIEICIAILGIIMIYKKKYYGWFFLVTFGIYTFYDFIKLRGVTINQDILYISFFIATLSALILSWKIYTKK